MKNKKNNFIVVLICVSPIIIFLIVNLFLPSANCSDHDDFVNQHYQGIISKKFLNYDNHKHETITIETEEKKFDLLLIKDLLVYEYIMEGDSVFKKSGSDNFEIKRNNIGRNFQIAFGCNE